MNLDRLKLNSLDDFEDVVCCYFLDYLFKFLLSIEDKTCAGSEIFPSEVLLTWVPDWYLFINGKYKFVLDWKT